MKAEIEEKTPKTSSKIPSFLEVKKRKLQLGEKLKRRCRSLDVTKLDFQLIDELDEKGQFSFLGDKILKNFKIIVNSTLKSVVRINNLKINRPNFVS